MQAYNTATTGCLGVPLLAVASVVAMVDVWCLVFGMEIGKKLNGSNC
jgi:hypothetical protein